MKPIAQDEQGAMLERAMLHLRSALELCDLLAKALPACHLQYALDLLDPEVATHDPATGRLH